jgi:hypothetical protein
LEDNSDVHFVSEILNVCNRVEPGQHLMSIPIKASNEIKRLKKFLEDLKVYWHNLEKAQEVTGNSLRQYLEKTSRELSEAFHMEVRRLLDDTPENGTFVLNKMHELAARDHVIEILKAAIGYFRAPICFVMQPFDRGEFDSRYKEVLKKAIKNGGFRGYRVDEDSGVSDLRKAVEEGIRKSALCLAEISTDNPNVWYEVGYADASEKDVILLCSSKRSKYPFNVQHRAIVSYEADASDCSAKLQCEIEQRLLARRHLFARRPCGKNSRRPKARRPAGRRTTKA